MNEMFQTALARYSIRSIIDRQLLVFIATSLIAVLFSLPAASQTSDCYEHNTPTFEPSSQCNEKYDENEHHPPNYGGHLTPPLACLMSTLGLLPLGLATGLFALPRHGRFLNGGIYTSGVFLHIMYLTLLPDFVYPQGVHRAKVLLFHVPGFLGLAGMSAYNFFAAGGHSPLTRGLVNLGGGTATGLWFFMVAVWSARQDRAARDNARFELNGTPNGVIFRYRF